MKKVLVVDDDEQIRGLLVDILEAAGFAVESARDGIEALEKMHQQKFDCVTTDLRMPRMDGRKLAEEIRRLFPQVPAIMMTANVDLAKGAQVYRVLAKPLPKMSDLVDLVKLLTGEPMQ